MNEPVLQWRIGDIVVTRVQEIEAPGLEFVIPDATPERLRAIDWLRPHFVTSGGHALASIHALVVESGGRRIVVDTCVGNDKRGRPVPAWNRRQGRFLEDLDEAGFATASIDTVVCTHLHVDHVGWNTRLVGDRWVPTFASARYLAVRAEYEHWLGETDAVGAAVFADSVAPVMDAGLMDLVASTATVADGVVLEPTPGHTPGHVSVRIESKGERAVITGDLLHHPAQFAHPEWRAAPDVDPDLACATRRAFFERYADGETLVIGTHFAGATAGRLVRDGTAFRLDVD